MAKAEVIRPQPVPVEVVLTMTEDEARMIRALCGSIGGISKSRELTSDIYHALADAGVPVTEFTKHFKIEDNRIIGK